MSRPELVVVGAGAAGILAALRGAELGAAVTLYEKTGRLGTKITISGGGKCNITHHGTVEQVLSAFRANEARFLRPSFYKYPSERIVEFLTARGLEVMIRPDGRIFPVHQNAKDVVGMLEAALREARVEIRTKSEVTGINVSDGAVTGVRFANGSIRKCDQVIVAVGGSSYPGTGTTGDGFGWAKAMGHTVIPVRAALAPIYLEVDRTELSGVSFRGVTVRARASKELARWTDDLLFTHHGVSGPCALGISREIAEVGRGTPVRVLVNILPKMTSEQLQAELISLAQKHPHQKVITWLSHHMAERIAVRLMAELSLEIALTLGKLEKKARNRLVESLKGWDLGLVRHVPLEKGEVVAGGIALDEVDPQTMKSKLVRGFYPCGELLDVAGPVGGYNLQAAWSTGWVAATSAVESASN